MKILGMIFRVLTLPIFLSFYHYKMWKLKRKLLAIGGKRVAFPHFPELEADFKKLSGKNARAFKEEVEYQQGFPRECHYNSFLLFKKREIDLIVTGYVLNGDVWRPHSWGVKLMPQPLGNKIIETTIPRDAYYGIVLEGKDHKDFCESQIRMHREGVYGN